MQGRGYAELWVVVGGVALALMVLVGFAAAGWPGQANGCIANQRCFCEAIGEGWVRQPANTWSNLGFIAVGLGIAAAPGRRRRAGRLPRADNPMAGDGFFPALYGLVVALLGPGSMALHASMTAQGGRWDVLSMYVWVAFCVAYAAYRAVPLGRGGFTVLHAALVGGLAWSLWNASLNVDAFFGMLIGAFALGEAGVWWRRPELRQTRRWLLGSGASFVVAFAVWIPSRRSDGALCDPDSLLQGHALWHLLCALATLLIWLYYRSERRIDA